MNLSVGDTTHSLIAKSEAAAPSNGGDRGDFFFTTLNLEH
jgi:hypothetical protein